jgi:hypothetical protein
MAVFVETVIIATLVSHWASSWEVERSFAGS